MRASVANFLNEGLGCRTRRLLILGDMLELGEWSCGEHAAIIRQATQDPKAEVWLVGSEFERAWQSLEEHPARVRRFTSCGELTEELHARPVEGALVLLKGSRGIGLERALEAL